MAVEFLRVLGLLFLLAAFAYLAYLFGPRKPRTEKKDEHRTPADWGEMADRSERYPIGHARRVAKLARMLAEAAGLEGQDILSVEEAGHLHDIGEIDWCSELLSRQGALDPDERLLLVEHCPRGARLAQAAEECPWSHLWVRFHHERWDGTGYPDGLWAEDIPIEARILAIADSYDAMTHSRPYRGALDREEAITELQRLSGIHFDPRLVQLFAEKLALSETDTLRGQALYYGN